ncbi:MAG: hypothetical protein IJB73_04965 [Firmicutes bacterium]|nr:hypothetical protein [Bacillota bacterium]
MASKKKKKIFEAVIATTTAVALAMGGTFAWQSISQTALNEFSGIVNPGGRLHDDFDGQNKDVYVENFASEDIFARVRLDEFMQITISPETTEIITKCEDGSDPTLEDRDGWPTHIFGQPNLTDQYWEWETGGSKVYMPTFNMNKDSQAADVNGTYEGDDGDPTTGEPYNDYVTYALGQTLTADETWDDDSDDDPDNNVRYVNNTHTAVYTLDAKLISMAEWYQLIAENGGTYNPAHYNEGGHGNYWVYDTDGWCYWSAPIKPRTATGLLLNEVSLRSPMDDTWYYAINVVGQFITADDLGSPEDGTGFYDANAGKPPTDSALLLLHTIGVDTTGGTGRATEVSDAAAFEQALEAGGNIKINGTLEQTAAKQLADLGFETNYLWHTGGTITDGILNLSAKTYTGLFINNENGWPADAEAANPAIAANPATLRYTTINANSTMGIYSQAIAAPVTLDNVTVNSDYCGIYAEHGGSTTTLNNVTVNACRTPDTIEGYDWYNTAVAAATGAQVIINGGYYEGDNAVYVFSSGATVTINSGTFRGALKADAPQLTINGGTFDHDPTAFVDQESYDVIQLGDGSAGSETTWTVQPKLTAAAAASADCTIQVTADRTIYLAGSQDTITLTAIARDAFGNQVDLTGSGDLKWFMTSGSEAFPDALTDNKDGTATLAINGQTVNCSITAAFGSQSATVNITASPDITAAGQSYALAPLASVPYGALETGGYAGLDPAGETIAGGSQADLTDPAGAGASAGTAEHDSAAIESGSGFNLPAFTPDPGAQAAFGKYNDYLSTEEQSPAYANLLYFKVSSGDLAQVQPQNIRATIYSPDGISLSFTTSDIQVVNEGGGRIECFVTATVPQETAAGDTFTALLRWEIDGITYGKSMTYKEK